MRGPRWLTFFWLYLRGRPPWDSGVPAPELVRAGQALPPGKALDLGCGTGTNVRYLAEHGWAVTGVDFVPAAIAQARRKARGLTPAPQLLVGDVTQLETLNLSGGYDLALDMGCYHALTPPGRPRYAAGLSALLKPGAQYLLYAFQPDPARGLWGVTREQVETEFAAGFELTGYEPGRGRPSAWYYFQRQGRL